MSQFNNKQHTFKHLAIPSCLLGAMLLSDNALAIPPTVKLPSNINLATSFFDGFTGEKSSFQLYLQHDDGNSVKDNKGKDSPIFSDPNVDVSVLMTQLTYVTGKKIAGADLKLTTIIPIVSFDTRFGKRGAQLNDNGTSLGDITVAPLLQFQPVMIDGHPIFVQNISLGVSLPVGKYNDDVDFNQSSNAYAINPNWAATFFPSAKTEISWRLNYLYNFKNNSPAGSAPLTWEGDSVNNTQAGSAVWLNFATSYAITPTFNIGINGYYLKQITDDKVNGDTMKDSREQVFAVGPGVTWHTADRKTNFWINTYMESNVENRIKNDVRLQFRMVSEF